MSESFHSPTGSIIVSIVLGLGLSVMFRRACVGRDCVVIKAPAMADVQGKVYQIEDTCYTYTPYATACPHRE